MDRVPSDIRTLVENADVGRPLPPNVEAGLQNLLGVRFSLEGLSQLFQPGFPGARTFAIETTRTPDHAIETTLVGVLRDGRPAWTSKRTFVLGRDGALEIHSEADQVSPEVKSRNITVDLIRRALDVLALLDRGETARLTVDASNEGRYVCALHGFVFADETPEGPPVRSDRPFDSTVDREVLRQHAQAYGHAWVKKRDIDAAAWSEVETQLERARTPWDFLRLAFHEEDRIDDDDGELEVSPLGRSLLLAPESPPWRGALYLNRDDEPRRLGVEYRIRKTMRSQVRLARELEAARASLESGNKSQKRKAIYELGMLSPTVPPELIALHQGPERRVANDAARAIEMIEGSGLAERLQAFADNPDHTTKDRGLAYRVLAEHYPESLDGEEPKLRVHPSALIQRAAIPLSEGQEDGPESLGALLLGNPWPKHQPARTGLLPFRLELIDRLGARSDPNTLPALITALRDAPPPAEVLALSRALVQFHDPRAAEALSQATELKIRPAVP